MSSRMAGAALGVALLVTPWFARAQAVPPAAQRAQVYSAYEQQTIKDVLKKFSATVDPAPEGKTIERVDIVPLDVIEDRDPLPKWVDIFHTTSKRYIIRREVLLHEGQAYRQSLLDDTLRNLRTLPQLSLVVVVATRGSTGDRVGLIVITKDVWSLRPNWDYEISNGGLDELVAQPSETNLAGLQQTVFGNLDLLPLSYTLGGGYSFPRIAGTRIALVANANVILNRPTGSAEGSYGSLVTGQPLYSALTGWAWDAYVYWQNAILRRYENAQLGTFLSPTTGQVLPFEYRGDQYSTYYELTRSFGYDTKQDITFAGGISRGYYTTDFSGFDPRSVNDFVSANVPVSDTRVGPSIQYHTYAKRYLRVIDSETVSLQEDYRLGHEFYARVYPSFKALGATRDVIGLYTSAMYTWPLRDGIIRLAFESTTEPEMSRIADASITPSARIMTPTILGIGRIIFDATALYRWRNYLNATEFLGGDSRLRGYPTAFLVGASVMSYNVELRTRPIDIFTLQLAASAFYDVGDAFTGCKSACSIEQTVLNNFHPLQGAGVGLRGMLPQIDRVVYRFDVGFPLGAGRELPGVTPVSILFTLGQAFDPPGIGPTPVLPTQQ